MIEAAGGLPATRDELVEALLALTKSDDERIRLGAIQAALDRGWGRPVQGVELGIFDGKLTIEVVRFGDTKADPLVIEHEDA